MGLFGYKNGLIGRDGFDHRSLPAKEPFYLIPYSDRTVIVGLWLASAFTQYANQATRVVYDTCECFAVPLCRAPSLLPHTEH